jgi:hypothetical protein
VGKPVSYAGREFRFAIHPMRGVRSAVKRVLNSRGMRALDDWTSLRGTVQAARAGQKTKVVVKLVSGTTRAVVKKGFQAFGKAFWVAGKIARGAGKPFEWGAKAGLRKGTRIAPIANRWEALDRAIQAKNEHAVTELYATYKDLGFKQSDSINRILETTRGRMTVTWDPPGAPARAAAAADAHAAGPLNPPERGPGATIYVDSKGGASTTPPAPRAAEPRAVEVRHSRDGRYAETDVTGVGCAGVTTLGIVRR